MFSPIPVKWEVQIPPCVTSFQEPRNQLNPFWHEFSDDQKWNKLSWIWKIWKNDLCVSHKIKIYRVNLFTFLMRLAFSTGCGVAYLNAAGRDLWMKNCVMSCAWNLDSVTFFKTNIFWIAQVLMLIISKSGCR